MSQLDSLRKEWRSRLEISLQVDFGWDLSLRAVPRRGGYTSKWLREESDSERWRETEIDGERMEVPYGQENMNNREQRRDLWSRGRFARQPQKFMEGREVGNSDLVKDYGDEIENLPMGLVDGKKRQRVNAEEENTGGRRSMLEIENEISVANYKLADRTQ
ncbi:hypothetical protein EPI10_033430 [Gossypium australe]|uniref:Uncharacterized protein n=1 Tax=Gossypium australe TaxID=47621 RepID=A0A5B6X6V6_9ROSI|nr:hypothetical protein EPI10_033430 [Gossypium australe]